ncbi:MAG: peptidoglycan LD-endopeptidase LytH, partial [Solirubrobacteraceae bacterium]|nr:peptidoglycan LD-endopeptidase LytH [Solirubrobacteraceae bacterium]
GFELTDKSVSPRHAYVAGRRVAIAFAIQATAPLDLQVDLVREATGRVVRRFALAAVAPGAAQLVRWDGLTAGGEVAPAGAYRVRVAAPPTAAAPAAVAHLAGGLTLRGHIYPIRGPHADRGPIGRFGVARNGGRTHEGYDVNAACGTKLVAARGGRIVRADYDPVLYGNLIIVRGAHTERDYWYAHLLRTPRLRVGDRVSTGRRIGSIGATGNARTIGCHLHFEIHRGGRPIDPEPELHAWDGWS